MTNDIVCKKCESNNWELERTELARPHGMSVGIQAKCIMCGVYRFFQPSVEAVIIDEGRYLGSGEKLKMDGE